LLWRFPAHHGAVPHLQTERWEELLTQLRVDPSHERPPAVLAALGRYAPAGVADRLAEGLLPACEADHRAAPAPAPPPARSLRMPGEAARRAAFERWDMNANGALSLAEIDKAVVVGLYPIVTFQYSSTTLCQFSYHIQ
jgi:hypothetical protein